MNALPTHSLMSHCKAFDCAIWCVWCCGRVYGYPVMGNDLLTYFLMNSDEEEYYSMTLLALSGGNLSILYIFFKFIFLKICLPGLL